jgi:starch phosphorylase
MAYLAVRGSGAVNAVSRIHEQVSRHLFRNLFPRWPEAEVPVGHVTNGVHVPTWDSPGADELWERACGEERWRGSLEYVEDRIRCVDDSTLWQMRSTARSSLVDFTRRRRAQQRLYQGATYGQVQAAQKVFDERWLTLGFARRFTAYKRPNMLLHDPERLARILNNPAYPVQLVLGGKAHPQDSVGQAMIKQWVEFVSRPDVQMHAAFLSDYDMLLTTELVAGVDLWLNTPRRPWEACGTSGMKVLANGGLNLSERDGWWAEAFSPDVGWAIGDGRDRGDDPAWDAAEAEALYTLLEQEVVPAFYHRDSQGIPQQWMARMRESMARLTPMFSANRMSRQYTVDYYLPLAAEYRGRAAERGRLAADLVVWLEHLCSHWREIAFRSVHIDRQDGQYFYRVEVQLGEIKPQDVQPELYASAVSDAPLVRAPMSLARTLSESPAICEYTGVVPASRPADHYTPRVVPRHSALSFPLESPLIAWQK